LSQKFKEEAEMEDQISGLQSELNVRDKQLLDMEEKNKKMT
jgi:hypothetical protein